MSEYHKIQTVWLRDPENKYKTLLEGAWAKEEFGFLAGCEWQWTEKVHGTNIRAIWDGERVEFRGRTDNAQLHPGLLVALGELITPAKLGGVGPCTLFGEGIGDKIQKGGPRLVGGGHSFILFDILGPGGFWSQGAVAGIADSIELQNAPSVGSGTLLDMVEFVKSKPQSALRGMEPVQAEGVVARPRTELTNRFGERVITKLKAKDFA